MFQAYRFPTTHDTYVVLWLWLCLFVLSIKEILFFLNPKLSSLFARSRRLSKPDETRGSNSIDVEPEPECEVISDWLAGALSPVNPKGLYQG